eukprot:EG_transcript_20179
MNAGARCAVLYDFSAVEEGELSVAKGMTVVVLRPPQDDWVMVQYETDPDKKGFVPQGYLAEDPKPAPAAAPKSAAKNILDAFDFSAAPAAPPAAAPPASGGLFGSGDPFAASAAPAADLFAGKADPFAAAQPGPFPTAPAGGDLFAAAPGAFPPPFPSAAGDPFTAAPAGGDPGLFPGSAPFPGDAFAPAPGAPPPFPAAAFPASVFPADPFPASTFPGAPPHAPAFPAAPFPNPMGVASPAASPSEPLDPRAQMEEMRRFFETPIEASPVLPPLAAFPRQELYFKKLMAERADVLQQLDSQ